MICVCADDFEFGVCWRSSSLTPREEREGSRLRRSCCLFFSPREAAEGASGQRRCVRWGGVGGGVGFGGWGVQKGEDEEAAR